MSAKTSGSRLRAGCGAAASLRACPDEAFIGLRGTIISIFCPGRAMTEVPRYASVRAGKVPDPPLR